MTNRREIGLFDKNQNFKGREKYACFFLPSKFEFEPQIKHE